MDVAIVGVGLHPFGRFAGVTGIEMGAIAIRNALADARVAWRDIQFAFAGSYEIDNPDAVVALLGLTGIPFTNVYNGCATAANVNGGPVMAHHPYICQRARCRFGRCDRPGRVRGAHRTPASPIAE